MKLWLPSTFCWGFFSSKHMAAESTFNPRCGGSCIKLFNSEGSFEDSGASSHAETRLVIWVWVKIRYPKIMDG